MGFWSIFEKIFMASRQRSARGVFRWRIVWMLWGGYRRVRSQQQVCAAAGRLSRFSSADPDHLRSSPIICLSPISIVPISEYPREAAVGEIDVEFDSA